MTKAKPIKIDMLTVFISEDPHQDLCYKPRVADAHKPYIRVKIKSADNKATAFRMLFDCGLGVVSEDKGIITLNITGYRNVSRALDAIDASGWIIKQEDRDSLNALKKVCDDYLAAKEKQPLVLPRKAKLFEQFEEVRMIDPYGDGSKLLSVVRKKKNPDNQKEDSLYLYKASKYDRSDTDIEVFNSFCYRLDLNDRHPKVRAVYRNGKRFGLLSKMVDGYKNYHHLYKEEKQKGDLHSFTADKLVASEVVKVWTAACLEKENDMHGKNHGPNAQGYANKIDAGRSEWTHTSAFLRVDPYLPFPPSMNDDHDIPITIPAKSFKLTVGDILGFPFLNSTQVSRWPTTTDAHIFEQYEEAQKNKKFIDDKYFIFLKRALIPDSAYGAIGLATIKSNKKRAQLVKSKCARTNELKKVLRGVDEFYDYLETPMLLEKILEDFEIYNNGFKKLEDDYLKIDLNTIRHNFHELKATRPTFFERNVFLRNLLISFAVVAGAALLVFGVAAILSVAAPALGITVASLFIAGSVAATISTVATIAFLLPFIHLLFGALINHCVGAPEDDVQLDDVESKNDYTVEPLDSTSVNAKPNAKTPQSASVGCFSMFKLPFECLRPQTDVPCEISPLLRPFGLRT